MKDQTISQLGRRLLFKLVRGAVDDWVAEGGTLAGPGDLALAVVERIWQAVQGAKVLRDQRPMFVLQLAQRGALGLVQEEVDVVVSLLRMANSKQEWTFKDWESVILQVHQQAVGTALAKLIPLMGEDDAHLENLVQVFDLPRLQTDPGRGSQPVQVDTKAAAKRAMLTRETRTGSIGFGELVPDPDDDDGPF